MLNIGAICREYRISKQIKLKDLNPEHPKTLSAFECGRSSNMEHFIKYLELSFKYDESEYLISEIRKGLNNG